MQQQEGTERQARRDRTNMENGIDKTKRVIDEIEQVLEAGRKVPLKKDLSVVNAAEIIDLLGQLRIVLPQSVRDAAEVLASSQKIIDDARQQADTFADQTEENCRKAIDDANRAAEEARRSAESYSQQVRAHAEADANAMIADAQARAEQMIMAAQQQAQQLVDENEITRRAQAYALETRDRAQQDAASIYNQACVQVDKMLSGATAALSRSAGEMAALRDTLLGQNPGQGR